jgi:hypothetical protein
VSDVDGLLRLINIAFRRYARDPDSRVNSSRLMLTAALSLHAEHTTAAQAADVADQVIDAIEAAERRRRVA